jgi:hypothetical protein
MARQRIFRADGEVFKNGQIIARVPYELQQNKQIRESWGPPGSNQFCHPDCPHRYRRDGGAVGAGACANGIALALTIPFPSCTVRN